jgi:hypothetical protein
MNSTFISASRQWSCAAMMTFGILSGMASTSHAADQNATIQKERADCMNGNSQQDRTTCMREAGAAKQEAQRGNLRDSGDYQANSSQTLRRLAGGGKGRL